MSTVILHFSGGRTSEIPESNLENTRRLLGGSIINVEYKDKSSNPLVGYIDDELIVEVINDTVEVLDSSKKISLEELKNSDKDVLRKLANSISEKNSTSKLDGRAGVDKLAKYIFDNQ